MIITSDPEYRETKLIRQGKRHLKPPFPELASWISGRYGVNVLNIVHDPPNDLTKRPRLQIIVEHSEEARKFQKGGFPGNYIQDKQEAIAKRFIDMLDRDEIRNYDTNGLFVIFAAFAPLAMQDADECVSDSEVMKLKQELKNPDLWEVSRLFGRATFFFIPKHKLKNTRSRDWEENIQIGILTWSSRTMSLTT